MKGITKLADFFIKSMEIIFIVVAILVAYFDIADFNYTINNGRTLREIRVVGEALMSCKDLTILSPDGYPVKNFFDENLLLSYSNSLPPCITYPKRIEMIVTVEGFSMTIGDANIPPNSPYVDFPTAVRETDGTVKLANMRVYVL